jgi:DNA-binding response OmpR family regulator
MASRILIIDDEEIVGESLRKTLAGEDYEIDTAHSGQEGLRKARRESFDLIIVDLKMPDVSGLDVKRGGHHAAEIPISDSPGSHTASP